MIKEHLKKARRKCKVCKLKKELNSINFPDRKILKKAPPFRWECRSCYNKKKRTLASYWASKLISGARYRSLKRGWSPCTLKAEDIYAVWPKNNICPVLGIKMVHGHENKFNSPTLERIDNNKRYLKENILVVSHRANCIKNDGTWQEIIQVGKFYKNLEKKNEVFERMKELKDLAEENKRLSQRVEGWQEFCEFLKSN